MDVLFSDSELNDTATRSALLRDVDTVCVTGGAGFIGSHIAHALKDTCSVLVYDNLRSGTEANLPEDVRLVDADVRDSERLSTIVEEVDIVFHHAALVSVQHSIDSPIESLSTNLRPIVTVLEAARGTDTRVVFASSAAIYGEPSYTPIDESHPKVPKSPYGLEKLSADHYCRLYHDHYGVEAVALRYFNVYGPRQGSGDYAGVISVFRDQALADDPLTIHGDGTQSRDFVHVDDVVRANLLAATKDTVAGRAFNIGTGEQTTIRHLAELIRSITDSDSDIRHVDERQEDIGESVADISRAQTVLDYDPQYQLRSGLEAYLSD